jgi:hypothetical protein
MPGYLGSIYSWDSPKNSEKVHSLTYSSIKKEASAEKYSDIISLNVANKVFEENPVAFAEQLPYYQIKIGYNFFIYLFYKLGFSGPTSLFIINFLSYFLSGLLIFYFLKSVFPHNYFLAPIVSTAILCLPALQEMAENPTPDIFSLVLLLLFMISVLDGKSKTLPFIFLLFSILIRPDYIIFGLSYIVMILIYKYFVKAKTADLYSLIFQGIVLTAVYIFIIKYFNYPGWKDVFYDTFIHRRPIISEEAAHFTFRQYWDLVIFKFINFKRIIVVSCTLLFAVFYISKDLFVRMLSVLVFLNIYFKFLLFPQGGTLRFFLGFVIILFLILIYAISKRDFKIFKLNKIS